MGRAMAEYRQPLRRGNRDKPDMSILLEMTAKVEGMAIHRRPDGLLLSRRIDHLEHVQQRHAGRKLLAAFVIQGDHNRLLTRSCHDLFPQSRRKGHHRGVMPFSAQTVSHNKTATRLSTN